MADNTKSFKDPAYGYIEIPSDLVEDVIDTEAFQRLRRIVQTSYEPLYPSATHNRFVHSLGVYHLGDIVASVIEAKSFPSLGAMMGKFPKKYSRYLEVFRLAYFTMLAMLRFHILVKGSTSPRMKKGNRLSFTGEYQDFAETSRLLMRSRNVRSPPRLMS